jgi:hypothetical protein
MQAALKPGQWAEWLVAFCKAQTYWEKKKKRKKEKGEIVRGLF